MKLGEYLKCKDKKTYMQLCALFESKIKLGDRPENLMKHDAHKRIGRRVRQIEWADNQDT